MRLLHRVAAACSEVKSCVFVSTNAMHMISSSSSSRIEDKRVRPLRSPCAVLGAVRHVTAAGWGQRVLVPPQLGLLLPFFLLRLAGSVAYFFMQSTVMLLLGMLKKHAC